MIDITFEKSEPLEQLLADRIMVQEKNRFAGTGLGIARFVMGFLFMQHGLEKLWGFLGGRIDHDFSQLHAWAGPIEAVGGTLLMLGLFTRTTAFIMNGEMAVAYFKTWAPAGFWPIANGGELAVLNCYLFLWLVFAGGGPWSLDAALERLKKGHRTSHRANSIAENS